MNSYMDVKSESETDSDWLSEKELKSQWGDRMRKTRMRNSFPLDTLHQKRVRKMCESIEQEHFSVTCGDKEGILHKVQYKNGKPCILSEGQWFTPTDFEKFGGKEKNKKWKISILYKQIPLQMLIQEGFLSSPLFKPKRLQEPKPLCRKKLNNNRMSSTNHDEDSFTSVSQDDVLDAKMKFRGEVFNVKCERGEGVLHVPRFATETSGKCIRTEDAWLTPKEFLDHNKIDGNWKRDIICNDIPFGVLIMWRVLEPHAVNCKCPICKGETLHLLDQKNDDVCFMCECDGDLVCCDECPRAFHHHCHTPALMDDAIGDYWTCSFCKVGSSYKK